MEILWKNSGDLMEFAIEFNTIGHFIWWVLLPFMLWFILKFKNLKNKSDLIVIEFISILYLIVGLVLILC